MIVEVDIDLLLEAFCGYGIKDLSGVSQIAFLLKMRAVPAAL
jgi:hypothetical protein